jgi:hypothetical protein
MYDSRDQRRHGSRRIGGGLGRRAAAHVRSGATAEVGHQSPPLNATCPAARALPQQPQPATPASARRQRLACLLWAKFTGGVGDEPSAEWRTRVLAREAGGGWREHELGGTCGIVWIKNSLTIGFWWWWPGQPPKHAQVGRLQGGWAGGRIDPDASRPWQDQLPGQRERKRSGPLPL